jgi:hypothetical protein
VTDRCRGWVLSTSLDLVTETDEENPMSTYFHGPALDSELAYRRSSMLRDAAADRLARQARQARRARRAAVRTAPAVRPVTVAAGTPAPAQAPAPAEAPAGAPATAGAARDQVARAA